MKREDIIKKITEIVLANASISGDIVKGLEADEVDVNGVAEDVTDFIYELIKFVGHEYTGANIIGNTSSPIGELRKWDGWEKILEKGNLAESSLRTEDEVRAAAAAIYNNQNLTYGYRDDVAFILNWVLGGEPFDGLDGK